MNISVRSGSEKRSTIRRFKRLNSKAMLNIQLGIVIFLALGIALASAKPLRLEMPGIDLDARKSAFPKACINFQL